MKKNAILQPGAVTPAYYPITGEVRQMDCEFPVSLGLHGKTLLQTNKPQQKRN
jgi:hypothetical protein